MNYTCNRDERKDDLRTVGSKHPTKNGRILVDRMTPTFL